MNRTPGLSLYNQNLLGDDDFIANFVARHDVLDALIRRLEANERDSGAHHDMLIGPRGMGKTSLLRRVSIAVTRKPELAELYVPLRFREEQYNVLSLGDFWRNCGEALAEWAESTGRIDLADQLDDSLSSEAWVGDEKAADQFAAEMIGLNRRAVLLVDNLDLILSALSAEDHWTFRRYLQARNGPIMIGAATQPLKDSVDRNAAFYQFFQPHYLEPLSEPETEICMRALAERRGNFGDPVRQVLDNQPERLKTLHTLTGGNPRVLTLIYRLLETAESEAAMADLEILLDQVTPYYKARIEEYQTPQQRAVIDAIALRWDPITTGDLSQVTSIPTTTLSPLLIKLRRDGLIESVPTSRSYAGHQLVERFLNIWYLMRHGTRRTKQKMRWLVGFLASFYSSRELAEIASQARLKGFKAWHADYAIAFKEALARRSTARSPALGGQATAFRRTASSSEKRSGARDARIRELEQMAREAYHATDFVRCKALLNELLTHLSETSDIEDQERVCGALYNTAVVHREENDIEAEIGIYQELIDRFADLDEPALRPLIARSLNNKGVAVGKTGDSAGEIASYDETVARFGEVEEPSVREQVANALYNKALTLASLEDPAGEIAAYNELITRFGEDSYSSVKANVAQALVNKAATLGQQGDLEAAIATADEMLARFGDDQDTSVREQVASARLNRAIAVGRTGDWASEMQAYDDLLERIGSSEEPWAREKAIRALTYKAGTLIGRDDHAALIVVLDQVLARLAPANDFSTREQAARALLNKAIALDRLGDSVGEIATYDEVVARFAATGEPIVREQALTALTYKAITLGHTGDAVGRLKTYEDALALFGGDTDAGVRSLLISALIGRAEAIGEAHGDAAAVMALEQAVDHAGMTLEGKLAAAGAQARIRLANRLLDLQLDVERAEKLFLEASAAQPVWARANLIWLYLLSDRLNNAESLRKDLDNLPPYGIALIDAALELARDNLGSATKHLERVFGGELDTGEADFADDISRLLRLAAKTGYGDRLLEWFEQSGFDDRLAPLYVAFKAYVQSESVLLDVNPEVRQPARIIFDRLEASRRQRGGGVPKTVKSKRGRGRSRKSG